MAVRKRIPAAYHRLVLVLLAVGVLGYIYGGLELAGIAPSPVAHAATSSTTAYLKPAMTAAETPRPCTFDGGGTIASGDAARTDTGEWVCTDGTLVHVAGYGNSAHLHTLPAWVRWRTIHTGECGKNHAAIVVWPAKGGTSALVCQSGVVETS